MERRALSQKEVLKAEKGGQGSRKGGHGNKKRRTWR
jgi:hypothetical protein